MMEPMRRMVSSFTTYSSFEIAAAASPVPRRAVPVLVMIPGLDGSFSMISSARCEGGGVARPRLGS